MGFSALTLYLVTLWNSVIIYREFKKKNFLGFFTWTITSSMLLEQFYFFLFNVRVIYLCI